MSVISNISGVVITYNEEAYIRPCIEALQRVVDEVVVVDSYSTDGTKAICEELGVVFLEHKWEGFAETKNWANTQCSNAWILSVDADEVLSDTLIQSINQEKKKGLQANVVYRFNRLNNYCGVWLKYAGWYPDMKARLFEKSKTRWEGDVHEKLTFKNDTNYQHLKGDLLHYSIKDKEDHLSRVKKYCKLEKPYPSMVIGFLAAFYTFFRSYILKRGFMAGKIGFQVSYISALAKWWRGIDVE